MDNATPPAPKPATRKPAKKKPTRTRAQHRRSREARRSRFLLLGGAVLSAVILAAWFPANALYHQHSSLASASAQLTELHRQDQALAQERKRLSDSAEIARIARQQDQLVSSGQQALAVLPPTRTTKANAPYAGDPALTGPVSPSSASVIPASSETATTTPRTTALHSLSSGKTTAHRATPSSGMLSRMLGALELLAVTTPSEAVAVTVADRDAVSTLLGRVPNGEFEVVVRRADGRPVVIANDPYLRDGEPMPTRYWLVDREIRALIGRLESEGGVRRAEEAVDIEALRRAHERYATDRDALVPPDRPGPRPHGGVGGTRRGVKCLHAHVAWWLAGGDDPVGQWVSEQVDLPRHDLVVR